METRYVLRYDEAMTASPSIGDLLREWRQRRRLSQLALACDAEVSSRHLSFVETGRALPSRDMVLHLAECLEVPLRARNTLLIAAGYAPTFPERLLTDPVLVAARQVIDLVLAGHEPYPALAIDRHWNLIASNEAVKRLLVGVSSELLQPPVNVLRLSLHPSGLAPRIANLAQWRSHLLARLRQQIESTADPILNELLQELCTYPAPTVPSARSSPIKTPAKQDFAGIAVPLQIETEQGVLSFLSTTTVFGTPTDITLSEIALETFFPADTHCATVLHSQVTPQAVPT